MTAEKSSQFKNDGWCFAIVNGRLAEIHFSKGFGIWGHAYVDQDVFSKQEQKVIDADIKKYVFSYRKNQYYDKLNKIRHERPDIHKIFPDLKGILKKNK